MTNSFYDKGSEERGKGNIDWVNADIRCVLVDLADYAFNAAHESLEDIPAAARVAISPVISGKTVVGSYYSSDPFTFPGVTGDQFEAYVFYLNTGVESTSTLITFHDTATNLPATPNGEAITIQPFPGPPAHHFQSR